MRGDSDVGSICAHGWDQVMVLDLDNMERCRKQDDIQASSAAQRENLT